MNSISATDIVKREKDINEAKYKRIIENTLADTNRIFAIWEAGDKKRITYENYQCVFRSNLSKYFWEEFPSRRRKSVISKYSPTCLIVDNEIVKIVFSNTSLYRYFGFSEIFIGLDEVATKFDYIGFNNKNRYVVPEITIQEANSVNDISFDSITSIKF